MKQILISKHSIRHKTDKAILFTMSKYSDYSDYRMWLPKSLLRYCDCANGDLLLNIVPNFNFKLSKFGTGKHNRYTAIDTVILSSDEVTKEFDLYFEEMQEKYFKITNPKPISKEIKIEVLEELINN